MISITSAGSEPVYVTASTLGVRQVWVEKFQRLFDGVTVVRGIGVFEGHEENVTMVSHLYDSVMPDFSYYQLTNLVHNYKREAMQDAVLVVEREVKGKLY